MLSMPKAPSLLPRNPIIVPCSPLIGLPGPSTLTHTQPTSGTGAHACYSNSVRSSGCISTSPGTRHESGKLTCRGCHSPVRTDQLRSGVGAFVCKSTCARAALIISGSQTSTSRWQAL